MRRLLGLICITALFLITAACSGGGGDGGTSATTSATGTAVVEKPTVSSTVPAQNQTNVTPNTIISAVFSNPMKQDGINYDGFIVIDGTNEVPGTVSCLGNTAIFRPSAPLKTNTTYTVKVNKNIKDINGNGMEQDQTWSFTTGTVADITPPHVTASNPYWNSVGVSVNSSVLITFSEPVDPATVNATTLTVTGPGGPVAGAIATTGINASFIPNVKFDYLTPYTITITRGVKDFAGNPLNAATVIKFSTGDVPDVTPPQAVSVTPASGATGVDAATDLTVTFSEAVIPTTVSGATFVVSEPGGKVTGSVSTVDNVATFKPSASLKPGVVYTAIAKTGIKDLAGNPLSGNFTWSFTVAGSASSTNSGLFADSVAKPTGSWPEAVAIGDVNNDGRNDVVMVTSFYFDPTNDYKLLVFLQNADGTLATPVKLDTVGTYGERPISVAIGDVNGDGKNEVVVANERSGISVYRLDNAGALVARKDYASTSTDKIKIADVNNDGRLDVVGTKLVWYQKASSDLADPLNAPVNLDTYGMDLDVGDVNNDGLTDIVVMRDQGLEPKISVITQKPDGTLSTSVTYDLGSVYISPHGVAVGDINGDNKMEVVVSYGGNSPDAHLGVFTQNSLGTLDPVVSYTSYDCPEPVEIADVNGDGRKDIIFLHGGWNKAGVYLQAADGTLRPEELYSIPYASHYNPHGLAVGDINGDGKPDIVIADYNNGLVILYHK